MTRRQRSGSISAYADHFGPDGDAAILMVQAASLVMNPILPPKMGRLSSIPDGSSRDFDKEAPHKAGDYVMIWALQAGGLITPVGS